MPKFTNKSLSSLVRLLVSEVLALWCVCLSAQTDRIKTELGNNEETFVFTGTCPNGEPYRLFSYQKNVSGLSQSYYEYAGPVGAGTVQSETPPKVMAVRICRKLAEIINANYWE